jgi:hypothetical protein
VAKISLKSLVASFTRAARGFLGLKEKTVIPLARLHEALALNDPAYEDEEDLQPLVMCYLNLPVNARGADIWGSARCAYAEPQRRIVKTGKPSPNIEESLEEHITSSAAILTADYQLSFGHRAFLVVIRSEIKDMDNFYDSMVFGLYGTYDRDKNMIAKKLIVPQIDQYRRMTGLTEADPSDSVAIEKSISFIKLCKEQVFKGGPLFARDNWRAVSGPSSSSTTPHIS